MARSRLQIRLVVAITLLGCATGCRELVAVETDGPATRQTVKRLDFRRVYVPENRIGEMIRGEYVPYNSDEFATLMDGLLRQPGEFPPAVLASQAAYEARFDSGGSISGQAVMDLQLLSSQLASFPLDGCNLAISKPMWDEQPSREARLGRTNRGNQVLFVDRTGRLLFDWNSRGHVQANGDVVFSLSLPKSTTSHMRLHLPAGWTPVAADAVIREITSDADLSVWSILLKGSGPITLRLARPADGAERVAIVRNMNLTYSFDQTLVRLLAEIRFDVEHRPLDQLSFRISAPLRIRAAHLGDTELEFIASRGSSSEQIVTVQFPHQVQGIDRRLKLDAVMSPILERDWKLPTITVLDAQWQEARTTLEMLAPISLDRLQLVDCVQTSVNPLREPPGQAVQLQHLTSAAALTVWLGREPQRSSYVGGTTIRLLDEELRANVVLDITSQSGSQFEVDLEVPQPWIVESVKALGLPSEDLATEGSEETNVPLDWNIGSVEDVNQSLKVSLKKPIRPDRVLRLQVQTHRPRPPLDAMLPVDQIQVVTPRKITRKRHLVALYSEAPYRFELQSDKEIEWFEVSPAKTPEQSLITAEPGGLVFALDTPPQGLQALLTQSAARFTSSIEVRTLVQQSSLVETFRIRCTPVHNARFGKVQVAVSHSRGQNLLWSLDGEFAGAVAARRLSVDEQRIAGIVTSEDRSTVDVWEITLARPRNVPFTLVGRRRSPLTDTASLALAWMPKASSQDGTLILESDGGTQFDVQQTDLTPFPLTTSADGLRRERAAYRYRPVDLPVVRVIRSKENDTPVSAWAWSCLLTSRISEAQAVHSACYRIECVGPSRISLRLPAGSKLRDVLVDGQAVNVNSLPQEAGGRTAFSLPIGVRYPTVVVTFMDQQGLPALIGNCRARLPEISIPVLRCHWTLWIPPDIACKESTLSPENALPKEGVATRLLGPLMRTSKRAPLDAAQLRSWWKGLLGVSDDIDETRSVLQALAVARDNAATWSQLVTRYAELSEPENPQRALPKLFVDPLSLQHLAITPATQLPATPGGRIEDVLDHAGLGILMLDDRIVLVSQLWLSARREVTRTIETTPVCQLIARSEVASAGTWMPAAQWRDCAAQMPFPWDSPDYSLENELFHAGWSAVEFEIEPGKDLTVELVRSSRILLVAWAAFFSSVGLGWWVWAVAPQRLFVLALLSGVAAILIPFYVSIIATAPFLGLLLGGAIGVVSGRLVLNRSARMPLGSRSESPSRIAVATTLLVLLAFAATAFSTRADDDSENKPQASIAKTTDKIYSVVIPIDKRKRPAGDVVYLPRDFFEALLTLTANRDELSRSWLIRGAEYDFSLAWKGVGNELAAAGLNATYYLDIIGNNTEVVLPLSREHLKVMPDRAMLNGKSVQVDWASDGDGLILDAGRPGSHMLELAFRPMTSSVGELQSLGLTISTVPNSLLRVHLPAGAARVEIPNSLGAIDRSGDRVVTAHLGPVPRLDIRWPASGVRDGDTAEVAVSQLFWLRVNQGSVVMRSKFRFSTQGTGLDQVAIRHDPRLQLRLNPDQPVEIVRETSNAAGTTRTVYFRPTSPDMSEVTLEATFAVSDTSGIGDIPLPRVEAVADQTVRSWVAVSVGPGLQLAAQADGAVERMETHDFLGQWNDPVTVQPPPEAVFQLKQPRRCQFSIHPRPLDIHAQETLRIGIGKETASLQYRADIEVAGGDVFRMQLQVPDDLELTKVTLQVAGQPRTVHWKRTSAEMVTVVAAVPLDQPGSLSLFGVTRISRRNQIPLPDVTIQSIPVAGKQVELYRQASVRLRLARNTQWQAVPFENQGSLDPDLGRLVAVLTPVSQPPTTNVRLPRVSIQSNVPSPSYQLAIVASRIDGQWWAEIGCRLHSFEGLVDTLRLDIPATWAQPFEAEGAIVKRIDTPGSSRSQLLVHWPHALSDASVVRLKGKLGGQPRGLPDIRIADRRAKETDRFVALQVKSVDQKTDWQTAGLRETPWPDLLTQEFPLATAEYQYFRVVGQRFRAWVGNIGPVAGVPQVRLVDVHVNFAAASYSCIASFDLEPAGLETCLFQLPADARLMHVSVAGHPAMTSALANRRRLVHLSHNQLPQRIELLYWGAWRPDRDDVQDELKVELPHIVDVPVERTLITLAGRRGDMGWQPQGAKVDDLRQELFRLRSMTTLIDLSRTIAKDQIPLDKQRWYLPWARCMVASTRNVALYRGKLSADEKRLDQQLSDLSSIQIEAAEDLRTIAALNEEMNSASAPLGLVASANAATFTTVTNEKMIAKGRIREIKLSGPSSPATSPWQRLLTVVLFLLVSLSIYLLATRGPLGDWFVHWPFVFGVIAGLFWGLYLRPSVVGWLIILVSVFASLRSHGNREMPRQRRKSSA